jgi:DNA polymerase I
MVNIWLQKLKEFKANGHAGGTNLGPEIVPTPEAKREEEPAERKNTDAPEKALDKLDKNTPEAGPKAKPKPKKAKKKLTPEEEYEQAVKLAGEHGDYVVTEERARECWVWAAGAEDIAVDIETYGRLKRDGLLYTRAKIRLISLYSEECMWLLDCKHVSEETVKAILTELRKKHLLFHNALFDVPKIYRAYGVLLDQTIDDTLLASRVCRAGEWERTKGGLVLQVPHKIEACIERELEVEIPKEKRLKWDGQLTEEHLVYAGDDVYHLDDLFGALQVRMQDLKVMDRYEAIRSCLPDFIGSAVRGISLDADQLQQVLDSYAQEVEGLKVWLDELAPDHPEEGKWVWGNTSKEATPEGRGRNGALRALKTLGLKLSNLQDQTLLDHREDHEIIGILYDYRKKSNTLARYRKWIPDFYDPETGRLYPQPKVAAAVTGRVLYSDPNSQGIDKHRTREFRNVVRAPTGRMIVKGDFAQQELRIAAYFSEDRAMLRAFKDGRDIYQETAKALVGHEVGKDDPARSAAKRATLGFLYGLGIEKYRINVYKDTQERLSGEQAVKDRQAFREAFPTFHNWQRHYGSKRDWATRSVLGWRRYIKPVKDRRTGDVVPKYTERLNGPIQSTAGDILYLTLQKMREDPREDIYFLLSVHDELVLECPEEDARDTAIWLKSKMRSAIEEVLGKDLGGEKSVEVSYGPSWGETTEEV